MDIPSPLFRGALDFRSNQSEYTPLRLTEKLIRFNQEGLEAAPYALCPAGISLDFTTTAEEIALPCRVSGCGWFENRLDVQENGLFSASMRLAPAPEANLLRYRKRGKGRSRIRIWLPVGAELQLGAAELGDALPTVPVRPPTRVLVFGDSISQGLIGTHPSFALYAALAERRNWEVLNLAVGGDVFHPQLVDPELAFEPEKIFVCLGTNDLFWKYNRVSFREIQESARAFFHALRGRYPATPVFAIGLPRPLQFEFNDEGKPREAVELLRRRYGEMVAMQPELAREFRVTLFDADWVFPPETGLRHDTVHPNDAGFLAAAENLAVLLDEADGRAAGIS